MPRYRVIEYHSYALTFEVEADTEDEAKEIAENMSADEADEDEIGCDEVRVEPIN